MQRGIVLLAFCFLLVLFLTLHYLGTTAKIMKELQNIETGLSKNTQEENIEENLKQVTDPTDIHTMLCNLPSCPSDCDVCCNMPYNSQTGQMAVHHWIAATGLWNEQHRFTNLSLTKASTVVYVGANNNGADGKQIMDLFNCTIHLFEPVPAFFKELEGIWDKYKTDLGFDATLYNQGLGSNDRTVFLASADLDGQSTFGMKENEESKEIPLQIKEAANVFKNITAKAGTIDLMHVNCEGCEWEMFDNLIETRVLETVRSIQFSSHYFSQVPNLVARYCKIKEYLKKTHRMVYGQSFGWERWDIKE
eukprot:TRINITY_DN6584_c0_g1_i1.p1 TRINITY_DN6584_c0_g1~~TRINITY_DN6584_c0_g1_i1.p1  ORF type:complete len:306 (+),score=88.52 TRINITY_DN6584_c0_g1_i1:173-1090(+)